MGFATASRTSTFVDAVLTGTLDTGFIPGGIAATVVEGADAWRTFQDIITPSRGVWTATIPPLGGTTTLGVTSACVRHGGALFIPLDIATFRHQSTDTGFAPLVVAPFLLMRSTTSADVGRTSTLRRTPSQGTQTLCNLTTFRIPTLLTATRFELAHAGFTTAVLTSLVASRGTLCRTTIGLIAATFHLTELVRRDYTDGIPGVFTAEGIECTNTVFTGFMGGPTENAGPTAVTLLRAYCIARTCLMARTCSQRCTSLVPEHVAASGIFFTNTGLTTVAFASGRIIGHTTVTAFLETTTVFVTQTGCCHVTGCIPGNVATRWLQVTNTGFTGLVGRTPRCTFRFTALIGVRRNFRTIAVAQTRELSFFVAFLPRSA